VTEKDLLELIASQVSDLTKKFDGLDKKVDNMEANMATKDELAEIKGIIVRMENEHSLKLGALFDGYTLNAEKLDQIEKLVAKHEETLLTKVK
jgi:hypothetical protein